MSRNAVETVMGAVVLVIAAVFLYFAYTTAQVRAVSGYELTARFDRIDGIRDGSEVKISGITVGSVTSTSLDYKTFQAVIHLSMDPRIKLPVDSAVTITSSGLLGDKFVKIEPGNEDDILKAGGQIDHAVSPMDLEALIGQAIFSGGTSGAGAKKADGQPQPEAK
jgi:phospholipid/cholesterol/gamma-HCH transport system substrate-binding protein